MHNQGNQADQGTEDVRHGDPQGRGHHAIGRSIRPGTAVPDTLLVADMLDGSVVLQGWRDGPTAYLCLRDAAPLKRELAAAFGTTEPTPRADEDEAL